MPIVSDYNKITMADIPNNSPYIEMRYYFPNIVYISTVHRITESTCL